MLCNIFYIDEWPGEIMSFADSFEPGGFCWDARRTMEVPNGWFNAGELVYIVEVILAMILAHLQCHVLAGKLVGCNGVHEVEAVMTIWMIQDEGVCVEVGDDGTRGRRQRFMRGHCHPLRTVSTETAILVVRDGRVSRCSKFAGTLLTSRAGARMFWSNFLTVVAGATAPFGRWNTAEDTRPVGRDGSDMRKALDVAPVLLTTDGIVPFNTPMSMLL